uniref:Transposase MuDR plant domain-containing protein n=1 Tax=Triticum urartu TaxID=4572 RepID=A0A8R7PI86_TRIUA
MVPVRRHNKGPVPKYAHETDHFTTEFVHGGFFMGIGGNRSYVNGRKVCYDYCEADMTCMAMFDELIETLGYERKASINTYLLLPGMQINEDGLRLLSKDSDTTCIRAMVREGHRFLMFYLEHGDNITTETWDIVIANPTPQLHDVIRPMKCNREQEHESVLEQSNVPYSHVDEGTKEGTSTCRVRGKTEKEDDAGSDDESSDSDYAPSLVDSDYDLEDGDEDLFIHRKQNGAEKEWKGKGKEVVEDDISEDDRLDLPDSDEEDMKFNFKYFTEADMNEPKFHLGQVFSSIDQLRKAIREYSCKERLNITFPKNDKTRLGAKCNDGCPWYLYASYDNRTQSIM